MKKNVRNMLPNIPMPLLPPQLALRRVTSRSGNGIYASSDTLFKGAVFGRDSLEVAEDLMSYKPRLIKNILITLAKLQGTKNSNSNEEELGKMVHEYRTIMVDGKPIKDIQRHIFDTLTERWGGTRDTLAYYGSVDATPHYLRVAFKYISTYGDKILNEQIQLRDESVVTFDEVLKRALKWLINKINSSRSGLIEYKMRNPLGIHNQVWKDSDEFYIHKDRRYVNHDAPVASIEVQALAYDALMMASELWPDRAQDLKIMAMKLRDKTISHLWDEKQQYFSLGIDYDAKNKPRVIKTLTANPAELLDSDFFESMEPLQKEKFVTSIVRKIMGREFLTDAGIRSRALSEAQLIPYWDYHGSYTTWPKETYDIAKGLRRHKLPALARELENRILNTVLKTRQYPEFIYVDGWGRMLSSAPGSQKHGNLIVVDSTNKPESIQAWTVSAVVAIINSRMDQKVKPKKTIARASWQSDLENEILANIPRVGRLLNPLSLSARYPTYSYKIVRSLNNKP